MVKLKVERLDIDLKKIRFFFFSCAHIPYNEKKILINIRDILGK